MTEDLHYRVLKHLEAHPDATQRDLAKALGISLGSTNFCVRALINQGWVKVQNFRRSDNKLAYAYLLTPQGIEAKARITARFLKRKRAEFEALKVEIAQLDAEVRGGYERKEPADPV
ncbi:MarR family EPS-associated transcriptional regulator [Thiocapsa imhoffii]|uniref:MarR family EPS-associated transcriptional regulator n=1 Tax=Thiocapsa imhoffii TaxID=382777 RepID=A0A9X0WMM2_9GAMM|nr:MarR family EPS-associated transcriptional regulator [Thiocapsa imhoffii]MBK1646672.1 MarR family EPS-associated transcriptional regulator [Thiocapsa imhoffii]